MRELRDGQFQRGEPAPLTPEGTRRRQAREAEVSSDHGPMMDGEAAAGVLGAAGAAGLGTYMYLDQKAYERDREARKAEDLKSQIASELAIDQAGLTPVPEKPEEPLPEKTEEGHLLRYEKGVAYVFTGPHWERAPEKYQPN